MVKNGGNTQLEPNKNVHIKTEEESSLKGTLTAVFIMGALIVLGWAGAFMLYLSRA
jgi:hypothetical protein